MHQFLCHFLHWHHQQKYQQNTNEVVKIQISNKSKFQLQKINKCAEMAIFIKVFRD